jgi:benzodiazapine receptor
MGQIASTSQIRMSFVRWALVTVPLILLLGVGSGQLANSGYGNPWFDALDKPSFIPPGWVFGVVWTILYILMGLALAYILSARGARGRGMAVALFMAQLVINLAWSPVFFALHQVTIALGMIVAMFVLAAITAWRFAAIRRAAGLLMLPYLAWLLLATALNFEVMRLNPAAETLAPGAVATQIEL